MSQPDPMSHPARRFSSDPAEVEQWISDRFATGPGDGVTVAEFDQLEAAGRNTEQLIRAAGPGTFTHHGPAGASPALRPVARAFIAVETSVGGFHDLCGHGNQIRPLIYSLDPPAVACTDCRERCMPQLMEMGRWWPQQCDLCGIQAERLRPYGWQIGHWTVNAQICPGCYASDQSAALGGRRRCPCGSRRRFKNCCGRRERTR